MSRRDPIRDLILGHAESPWMRSLRAWADAALWIGIVLAALVVAGIAH